MKLRTNVEKKKSFLHFTEINIQALFNQIFPVKHYTIALPDKPILGCSNSATNKDIMSKIWTNGGYNYLIE